MYLYCTSQRYRLHSQHKTYISVHCLGKSEPVSLHMDTDCELVTMEMVYEYGLLTMEMSMRKGTDSDFIMQPEGYV